MALPEAGSGGVSILITAAPQSASWRTAVGPARTRVRSSTVKRDSGIAGESDMATWRAAEGRDPRDLWAVTEAAGAPGQRKTAAQSAAVRGCRGRSGPRLLSV